MSTPKITVRDLSVRYGAARALHAVSIDIPANGIFAVIGPANSGKTTFLKCINRTIDLEPGTTVEGAIAIDGADIHRMRDVHGLRRRIGMVFPPAGGAASLGL